MRVAVTGAGGFIGDALCRRLMASGYQVIAVHREAGTPRPWSEIRNVGDLTNVTDFGPIVAGADAVVHLAARVHMMRETASDPEADRKSVV